MEKSVNMLQKKKKFPAKFDEATILNWFQIQRIEHYYYNVWKKNGRILRKLLREKCFDQKKLDLSGWTYTRSCTGKSKINLVGR